MKPEIFFIHPNHSRSKSVDKIRPGIYFNEWDRTPKRPICPNTEENIDYLISECSNLVSLKKIKQRHDRVGRKHAFEDMPTL